MTTSKPRWKAIRLLFLGCLLVFGAKAQATITLNVQVQLPALWPGTASISSSQA
jgi:hypothetical protein